MPRRRSVRLAVLATVLLGAVSAGATALGAGPTLTTLSGTGEAGSSGDGGPAPSAKLNGPRQVAIAADGILVADALNHRVRRIGFDGRISTVAGTGEAGFSGDGGPAIAAKLREPSAAEPLADGGVLVADSGNSDIRKVAPDGRISMVVRGSGNDDPNRADGDDKLERPEDISLTADGGFLVADPAADRVFAVAPDGEMRAVAGTGRRGFAGDGAAATAARLDQPRGVLATADGGFLVADSGNSRVRKVSQDGRISTVVGTGVPGFAGDGGPAGDAKLNVPVDLSPVSGYGYLIADRQNHRVRLVSDAGGITSFAGAGEAGFNGDGQAALATQLNQPGGTAVGSAYAVIADTANHRVRLWYMASDAKPRPRLPAADEPSPPAPPVAGKRVNAAPVRGKVRVKLPGADRYVELDGLSSLPVGTLVDTTSGAVRITSAADLRGSSQAATFARGAFRVRQRRSRRPVTDLVLHGGDFSSCKRHAAARRSAAAGVSRRRARRGLWGRGHGRFRTRGRHGTATVRGTIWFTGDRCAGTLVRVRRGVVAVRDLARGRRVIVRSGRSYLARPRSRRGR